MFARQVWIHGRRVYWDDFIAELSTRRFLEGCERDGRLTADERAGVALGKPTTGHTKPDYLIRYADFVRVICEDMGWPEEDVRRCLALRLEEENLLSQHVEFYLNYPAWTIPELAEAFGVTVQSVVLGLRRVRKTWPALRLDGTKGYGVQHLGRMLGFYGKRQRDGEEFNRLDHAEVTAICGGFSEEPYNANDPTNE
jgi:hypothetical protein